MDYTKVSKEIFDPIKANKAKFVEKFGEQLAELFPSAVKDGVVDFTTLLAELGRYIDSEERYELNWAGKTDAKRVANSDVIGKTLKYVPDDSKNPKTTENIYIEGDNLEVLKVLRNNYYSRIKVIYIDPPYNTGNDFVYKDNFSMSSKEVEKAEGDMDENDNRLVANPKSNGRYHSNWLNMMYPRLKVAKELLADDGVIFISIDANEVDNLIKICNELFGESNLISCISNVNNPKGRSDDKFIATAHEYILAYQKGNAKLIGWEPEDNILKRYNKADSVGNRYRELELRKTGDNDRKEDRPNLFYYFLYNDTTGQFYATKDEDIPRGFIQIYPTRKDGSLGNWRWQMETANENIEHLIPKYSNVNNKWTVYEKDILSDDLRIKPTSAWTFKDVNSERGTEQFIELGFDKEVFPKPKPIGTITRILKMCTRENDIILDFFSGSATTAHAVMQLNAEDNQNRKFIMIQLPDECDGKSGAYKSGYKTICEIGKERIRRAGDKIIEEFKDKAGIEQLDIGFKVLKVANTNIRWFSEAIKSDILDYDMTMTDKDKLDFNPGFTDIDVVYEILLRHRDIPLSTTVEQLSDIGNRTYIFADTVVVCLEDTISEEMINRIASIEPMPTKLIFRDSAFGDDISLKENTMIRLESQMRKNSGSEKRAYRVEFI